MKKLLFVFTLLSVLLPLRARIIYEGDGTVLINGVYYDLMYNDVTQERTAWVSSGDIKYTGDIVIPQSVTYNEKTYKVTNVDLYKDNSQNVTSVSLPEGIIEVGLSECAITSLTIPSSVQSLYLYKCYGLTSINLPNNLKSLGVNYCTGLTEIAIPNGVEELSMRGCSQITTITIPASVRYFEQSAFGGCTNLRSVTFSEGIKEIGAFIFENCSNLSSVNIPNSVKIIGDGAFIGTGLTSIVLPESLEEIGNSVFYDCKNLESINIPNDVIMNAGSVFAGCTALKNITFGNQVTMIGQSAFEDCTGLETIDIPSNIKTIGKEAFKNCRNLASVIFHEGLEVIEDGAFNDCDALTSITIPNSVVSIGSRDLSSNAFGTFAGCDNLKTVALNNSLTCIPSFAFYDCKKLESINIPIDLIEIGYCAFMQCQKITGDIVLPEGTTYIGGNAFAATNITSIKIPRTMVSFSVNALCLNENLKKVIIPSLEQWCTQIDFGHGPGEAFGYLYYRPSGPLHYASLYLEGHENTPINDVVVIPDGITHINSMAFYDASITSIDIPGSVETIGSGAFEYCSQLKTIKFHEGLKSIGNDAFAYCTALETLNLPNGLVELGAAFRQCTSLKSVEIPNSVTTAKYGEPGVFQNCTSLESVKMGNGMQTIPTAMFSGCSNLQYIEIPSGVKEISPIAFGGCKRLKKIVFPNSVTLTGASAYSSPAFYGCDSLTQVIVPDFNIADWCGKSLLGGPLRYSHHLYDTDGNDLIVDAVIPEGVTKVTEYAFQGCESMTSLTLPSTIASIGSYSFGYCSNLTSVTSNMKTPCTLNSLVFYNLPTCTLYIPYGTKDAYIAKGWTENIFKGGIVEAVDTRVTQSLELTSLPAKTYGDEAYTLPENTVEGLTLTWESDNTNVATISGNTLTVTGAGTATITASQAGNDDYKPFSREFALTVAKAPLTITANNSTKNVGEANPAFTASYEGFVNDEDVTVLTAQPTFTCEATADSPAGTYDINVSGAEAANYEITYIKGTLNVVEKTPQTISLTSLPDMTYGEDTYTLPAQTEEGFDLTWTSSNINVATISGNTLTVKGAGTATITASQAGNEEYKPFSKEFALTVAKAPLTITANDATKNLGEENPAFTASYEGFVKDEDASVLTTQPTFTTEADADSPVGTYDIVVSGAEAANYDITFVNGTLTVVDENALNNTLAIANVEACKGSSVLLPVSMNNTESIKGIQFDLHLPAGVSVATDADDVMMFTLTSRAHSSHAVSATRLSNGDYRVVVSSLSARTFSGTEGDIMNISLNVPDNVQEGEYEVKVHSIVLNTAENVSVEPADATATLTVKDIAPGDVNGDGKINVTDVGMVIDDILENTPANFVKAAADLNGDGKVNVTDVGLVIDIILSDDEPAGARKLEEEVDVDTLDPQ